ncbi:TolC family protein [Wenyingzhuangia sp. IMCC45533]
MDKIIWIFIVLFSYKAVAQDTLVNVLSYKEYINNIINEHPLSKSAQLKEKVAKARLLSAKGEFDPTLASSIDQKQFKGLEYYNIFKNKVSIPTPIGVNVTGGFENNSGVFLNPENNISGAGLWSAGLEVDVIQGLLVNTRRIALKQSRVYQNIAQQQQQQLLNELVYNASKAYAEWQQYASIYQTMLLNVGLSELYLKNTKTSFSNGEKTAIDTLEAGVYLQNSNIQLLKYRQLLVEKKIKVENNLWLDNNPVGLKDNIVPENDIIPHKSDEIVLEDNLDSIPIIAEKIGKRDVLILKQRLNREKLKPKLKLKYNQLFSTKRGEVFDPIYDVDDYKWGASLTLPIFFRTARGKYRESRYKVEELNYDIAYKRTEILNKIAANKQNQVALIDQIILLEQNINGYEKLLNAETTRFEYGESSLFLINKRQEKLIESKLKLLSTQNKLITNYLDYLLLTNRIIPND